GATRLHISQIREALDGYGTVMNASAWFMIAIFALFAIGLTAAVLLGAHRDREVEADVRRESRRRLGMFPGRNPGRQRR
ncbi:MAG: hypothetical protein J2P22_00970, partial [Nocardioides sp.]|nr:hypothetical protein [Nocardioides sp.]